MNRDATLSSVLIPNLVLLFAIALGLASEPAPLESNRPPTPATASQTTGTADRTRTPARLWEDPLDRACFPAKEIPGQSAQSTTGTSCRDCSSSLAKENGESHPEDLPVLPPDNLKTPFKGLVILIPLSERDYPEARETRLRSRYAVVSALGRANYIPREREHLRRSYLKLQDGAKANSTNLPALIPIAWEQFEQRNLAAAVGRPAGFTDVVVVWVGSEALTQTTLDPRGVTQRPETSLLPDSWKAAEIAYTADLLKRLELLIGDLRNRWGGFRDAQWSIIGPENSDQLEELYGPTSREALTTGGTAPTPIVFFSPRATMPEDTLRAEFQKPGCSWTRPDWIERTIADDRRVCEALVAELSLRLPRLRAAQFALIGEWDTVYGRTLAQTLSAALPPETPVHHFNYLRGLDGTSGKSADAKKEPATGETDKPKAAQVDRPDGNTQHDYLRRLADQVLALGGSNGTGRRRPIVVGVLGSDTYDKLIVLRALRPLLPGALFFTTDVDAAYLAPDQYQFTRNMIVASSYGLTLPSEYQGAIPPFRDGYQTALFATCLKILGVGHARPETDELNPVNTDQPSVFEIGRRGLVRMDAASVPRRSLGSVLSIIVLLGFALAVWAAHWGGALHVVHNGDWQRFEIESTCLHCLLMAVCGVLWCLGMTGWMATLLPLLPSNRLTPLLFEGLIALFITGAFLQMRSLHIETRDGGAAETSSALDWARLHILRSPREWWPLLLGSIGFLLLLKALLDGIDAPRQEPLSWTAGVSSWPSTFIRLVAIVLTVVFSVMAEWKIATTQQAIAARAGQAPARATRPARGDFWLPPHPAGAISVVPELLRRFHEVLAPAPRLTRITLCGIAFTALVVVVYSLAGEFTPPPVRGDISRAVTVAVLFVASLSFLYLLLYTIDTVLLSAAFVDRLMPNAGTISADEAFHRLGIVQELVEPVSRLIYYPFGVLFALIASRNPIFDLWAWPIGVVATFVLQLLLLIVAALILQTRARRAREAVLNCLNQGWFQIAGDKTEQRELRKARLAEQRRQTESLTGDAFAAWHRSPIVFALLIPLGGVGSLELLTFLAHFLPSG